MGKGQWGALLELQGRRHRGALLALGAGLFAFQWVLTRLAPGPEQAELMRQMFEFLPRGVTAMLGEEVLETLTPRGMLGFGYQHPFALLMVATWAVRASAGALAGEIGQGTMDLLAARPVPRGAFVAAGALAVAVGLAVLALAAWAGTATGLMSRPEPTAPAADLLPVALGLGLLFAAFGGVGLAISAAQRSGGAAIAWTSALVAGSFALDYLAKAWAPIRWMRPLSLFSHFRPPQILAGGPDATAILVLAGTGLAGVVVAYLIFARRDL